MLFLISQDGERIYNLNGHIEGIGYRAAHNYKRTKAGAQKTDELRHTIQVFDGCEEEVAVYDTKESCTNVLKMIAIAIRNTKDADNVVIELPTQEELAEQWEDVKRMFEMQKKAAREIKSGLEEMFNDLF